MIRGQGFRLLSALLSIPDEWYSHLYSLFSLLNFVDIKCFTAGGLFDCRQTSRSACNLRFFVLLQTVRSLIIYSIKPFRLNYPDISSVKISLKQVQSHLHIPVLIDSKRLALLPPYSSILI